MRMMCDEYIGAFSHMIGGAQEGYSAQGRFDRLTCAQHDEICL